MRILDADEANKYLSAVGMKIGGWNEIIDASGREYDRSNHVKYQAPKGSRELHNFAQHVASWLPDGKWKIFQIDNSTFLPHEDEAFLIRRFLFCANETISLHGTFLFDIENSGPSEKLLFSNLIYLFLLFEELGEAVSSDCRNGKYLSDSRWLCVFYVTSMTAILRRRALCSNDLREIHCERSGHLTTKS